MSIYMCIYLIYVRTHTHEPGCRKKILSEEEPQHAGTGDPCRNNLRSLRETCEVPEPHRWVRPVGLYSCRLNNSRIACYVSADSPVAQAVNEQQEFVSRLLKASHSPGLEPYEPSMAQTLQLTGAFSWNPQVPRCLSLS